MKTKRVLASLAVVSMMILVLTGSAYGQDPKEKSQSTEPELVCKQSATTQKWGYANKQGKIVIPCKYDTAADFSDGLALVSVGERAFFINAAGKTVITCGNWDTVFPFSEGFAIVAHDKQFGVIDKTGKEVIPCLYQKIQSMGEDFSVVFDNKMGYFDTTGKQIIPFEYQSLAIPAERKDGEFFGLSPSEGKWVKIDKEGKRIEK